MPTLTMKIWIMATSDLTLLQLILMYIILIFMKEFCPFSARCLIFSSNIVSNLNIPKPKCFSVGSNNLYLHLHLTQCFNKRLIIVEIKSKMFDLVFHFRRNICKKVEKIIKKLANKKMFPLRSSNWIKVLLLNS